ncbi:MAG: hypothetical protein L0Y72_29740 [Gemmataceae bacterium]|nr:hypothetical protein [Gemmataceae bacterium]
MFATLFGKLNRTSRNGVRSRQLEVETLEGRAVPSALATLVPSAAGVDWPSPPAGQVRELGGTIDPSGNVTVLGGARGGVDMDPLGGGTIDPSGNATVLVGPGGTEEVPARANLLGGKIGDGMNDGDDFVGTLGGKVGASTNPVEDFVGILGGKIGDGMNDGDDFAGRTLQAIFGSGGGGLGGDHEPRGVNPLGGETIGVDKGGTGLPGTSRTGEEMPALNRTGEEMPALYAGVSELTTIKPTGGPLD